MTISSFKGDYAFLSNFHPSPIMVDGCLYPTAEHAYQASKTMDRDQRARIARASTPGQAKRAGRRVTLRPDWDVIKLTVMKEILQQKFMDQGLRARLRATGTAALEEGNTWNDTYWGVCRGKGENHLGRILMEIRKENSK